jgi:DNA-binding transcriptional MerR regulator
MAASAAAPQIQKDFYRIGEVARMTDLKPFVLRYWETEFPMLEPVKSASGHRLYRAQDVDMVRRIKRLLYDEGFTIAGARRHLRDPNAALEAPQNGASFQLTSPDDPGSESHSELRGEFRGDAAQEGALRAGEARGEFRGREQPAQLLNRKMLLDLRDSLRAFLTLLEGR